MTIHELRSQLDRAGVQAPIHIFGGLDPLYTPLYFAAGAELFDGLGWLRYAYREGVPIHRDSAVIFEQEPDMDKHLAQILVCLNNLERLRQLEENLRTLAHGHINWGNLDQGEVLEPIYRAMQERLGR